MRGTTAAVTLAAGLLVGGCGAGAAPDVSLTGTPAVRSPVARVTPPASAAQAPADAVTRSTRRHVPVARVARPAARLLVPAVRIAAPVRPVGFAGRTLRIPSSVAEVGRWTGGARPGDAIGTTVLVGHVSDDRDRPGVLGRLRGLGTGAAVVVVDQAGRRHRYRVTAIRSYAKARLPRGVFTQRGPHRLVLITCSQRVSYGGGAFHYARNLVVTARPE